DDDPRLGPVDVRVVPGGDADVDPALREGVGQAELVLVEAGEIGAGGERDARLWHRSNLAERDDRHPLERVRGPGRWEPPSGLPVRSWPVIGITGHGLAPPPPPVVASSTVPSAISSIGRAADS